MKTMHFAGSPGTGYGWGVFNANMYRELDKHFVMVTSNHDPVDVCFMPVDGAFRPLTEARGKVNVCMNFFEFPLEDCAAENAAKFDVCFVGSTWCKDRCAERGIHNVRVLIQGVDGDIFKPQPPRTPDGTLRIFSGGKFEYRKGQDLVIAAFREFLKTHPNAHLVCSWFNPWPQLFSSMESVPNFPLDWKWRLARDDGQHQLFRRFLMQSGLEPSQFTILPKLSQRDMAREMANTDFGLFPNRCEGGNNLVLQEYLSCGRPAAANVLTGHMDIANAITMPIIAHEDAQKWAAQSVESIVQSMRLCAKAEPIEFEPWTWEAAARTVLSALD